ncbi:MAG: cyclase family protein [Arenicellales bacterium]
MSRRWRYRPEGSNWGEFGDDDQCGRLNLLTPEKVLDAISEVHEGLTFCLSLPLDYPGGNALNPRRHPPRRFATLRGGRANYNYVLADEEPYWTDVVSDDAVLIHTQYSTQWDSLAHVGSLFDAAGVGTPQALYYNGFRAGEDVLGPPASEDHANGPVLEGVEARRLGIENMAERCVQGRGVLIDLHTRYRTERKAIGYEELMRVCDADDVVVESGDMLCVHTGFARMLLDMQGAPDAELLHRSAAVLDGNDERLLQWITDSGIAVLIADNFAVEAFPPEPTDKPRAALPLHEHCLFKLGIHLGELWFLSELASWLREHRRSRFLLTAPPLRLPGAVGSPLAPVATV